MIDLHYWPTPNGYKITLFLEEAGVEYTEHPIDIQNGAQFAPEFLKLSPNNRMPAIVDTRPRDQGEPVTVFESGAILIYLAEKHGKFHGHTPRERTDILQWVMWQMGGLGPMSGQAFHFGKYAPEKIPYAIDRYSREVARLYGVLDRRLEGRDFIVGDYSIADMACYPWLVSHAALGQDLNDFPNVKRWFDVIAARPATIAAYIRGAAIQGEEKPVTEEQRKLLFGQGAKAG